MAKPLSMDLRERVLAAIAGGVSGRQAGERFGVSAASVSRWRAREREQGDARPQAQGGDRKSIGSMPIGRRSSPCLRRRPTSPSRNCVIA